MTLYFKTAVLTALIFFYLILGILFWKSESLSSDKKLFHMYESSQFKMALAFAEEFEKNSNSAKYPLFKAYILRDDKQLSESTTILKRILKSKGQTNDIYLLNEIYFNLSLNAFLEKNLNFLKEGITRLKELHYLNQDLNQTYQLLEIFKGLEAYLDKDYQKAISSLQNLKPIHYPSPWMQYAFEKQLTPHLINRYLVQSFIEESKFKAAYKKIEEMGQPSDLLAYCCFKEAETKTISEAKALHEKAITNLLMIKNPSSLLEELKKIDLLLQNNLIIAAKKSSWENFFLNLNSLNHLPCHIDAEAFSTSMSHEIEKRLKENNISEGFQILEKTKGLCRVKLLYKLHESMKELVKKGEFKKLQNYLCLMEPLTFLNEFNPSFFYKKISDFAFLLLSQNEFARGHQALRFVVENDQDQKNKLEIGNQLIVLGESFWLDSLNYEGAIKLFTYAKEIVTPKDLPLVNQKVEDAIRKIYQKADEFDLTDYHLHLVKSIKLLELNHLNLYDRQQKIEFQRDANDFFSKGHYKIASEKAMLVLELDPGNQKAIRILGLIAYEKGDFEKALHHLSQVEKPDITILKTLKLIQPKSN